jgi:hypothetical protein
MGGSDSDADAPDVPDPKAKGPRRYRRLPLVQYGVFVIGPPDLVADPLSAGVPAQGRLLRAGPGGVVLASAGNDFYPVVDVEVWPGVPPEDGPDDGRDDESTSFSVAHTHLLVRSAGAVPAGEPFAVGTPGEMLGLRARCAGRAEAGERRGKELFYEGVEHWLIQIWPRTGRGD